MSKLARLLAALAVALGFTLVGSPAAHAFGSKDNCDSTNDWYTQNNSWQAFAFHSIKIHEEACIRGVLNWPDSYYSWLKFTSSPDISFPNTLPGGAIEDVSLESGPTLDYVWRYGDDRNNRAYKVRYTFVAHHCVLKVGCDNYEYSIIVNTAGTKICADFGSNACDTLKGW